MNNFCRSHQRYLPSVVANFILLYCLTVSAGVAAQDSAAAEKKVDYLVRIYFSGENKEGLNKKILVTLQEIKEKTPTPGLAGQLTFLLDIQDKASEAKNACEVLDLLAVGIYNMDAPEAVELGVQLPTDKAKAKTADAIASLNKLSTVSSSLGSAANNLAWSSYILSGGKYSSFFASAGKVGNVAGSLGAAAGAAGQAGEVIKELGGLGKSLPFGKKDKPCSDVKAKTIDIGEHVAQQAGVVQSSAGESTASPRPPKLPDSTVVIKIDGISSATLKR